MKLIFPLLLLNFLHLTLTTSPANSPPFPIFGPCQKRCITQFGEIKERVTNTDTLYREVDVFNKTEFSLCKLGCNSPEYTDLNLPAFRYGQSAYQQILMNVDAKPARENVVKDVNILCLDNFSYVTKNNSATTSKRLLTGKALLVLDDGVLETEHVYFVEIVARDADDDDTYIVYQDWCYSSNCNVTFNAPLGLSDLEVRLRVSTFDENGAVGGIVLSRWYNINHILTSTSVDMSLKSVEWNDDKAAARLTFDQATSVHVPACSLQMMYKNALSSEYKHVDFYLDHTREVIVKKLDFNQTYTMRLVAAAAASESKAGALATTKFQVPPCSDMVSDMTMCAPPPVSTLTSSWNMSTNSGYGLAIEWTYFSDALVNQTGQLISMSHFMFTVHPLITTNNEKCEKYEPIRRDVTYTHRRVVFYVPDAECNYEVEVSAFDTKQRKSEVKKIKILRVNEPSYMSLLLATDIPTSVGLGALLVASIIVFVLIALFFVHKRRSGPKKVDDGKYGTGERMVYAYVDATDASRTVIGVRPLNFRFEPVENINRNIEAAIAQRTYGYNLHNGSRRAMCQNELYPYYQPQQQQQSMKCPPHMMLRVQPDGTAESTSSSLEDHQYETIMEYNNMGGSELSDEVFEEDICTHTPSPNSSFHHRDPQTCFPMAPIAPYEYFDTIPAYPFQEFQLRKTYVSEGNPYWRLTNVVDTVRGHSYTLKYGKDYSNETCAAMRKELEFLRTLPAHQNCVRFDGVVTGRWENVPYQITGLLMENCRGGSLRSYIISVGSVLRRQAMNTPNRPHSGPHNDTTLRVADGSPSPSSGYESFASNDRKTPERLNQVAESQQHCFHRVSTRFCQFAEQIASALDHLHRAEIIHTRVTTISVYLFRDYTDPLDMLCDQMVKLGDFGNASRSADHVVVDQNLQPPEVALGKKYETKGDIWQFGTCLVEMCSFGVPYQALKQIPLSGLEDFDKLPSTYLLQDAAKKCLNPRNRPSASYLRGVFQTDTAREMKAMDMTDQMKQSLLI
uniref:Protein kinase domain-containing protein n=1 Tax=Caenorhabditis japonica TaxID=281687 RepID=A0A8R1HJ74_CAEJA